MTMDKNAHGAIQPKRTKIRTGSKKGVFSLGHNSWIQSAAQVREVISPGMNVGGGFWDNPDAAIPETKNLVLSLACEHSSCAVKHGQNFALLTAHPLRSASWSIFRIDSTLCWVAGVFNIARIVSRREANLSKTIRAARVRVDLARNFLTSGWS